MDEKYFAKKIEDKWQKKWSASGTFEAEIDDAGPKFYQLEMLPYPSGNLHMGHVRVYSAGDALAWYKRLKGFNVLHPIGWDSFGQPAEDAAIKRGVNPRDWTEDNIKAMRGQLERLGISYDWRRQMAAHRPEYYKFDQWFFLKMYEMGLAHKRMTRVNWCETDQATLSNEQASGGLCWRCGNPVTKKDLDQWFFKTTEYADQLIDDMAKIESSWPQNVMKRQRDWIGRSEGAFVEFPVKTALGSGCVVLSEPPVETSGLTQQVETPHSSYAHRELSAAADDPDRIRVFTTRIDTIYGVNAVVAAAEHPIIEKNISQFSEEVKTKIKAILAEKLKPVDRETEIEKDGIDTGLQVLNPFSGEELPVWVGNYVMMEYGTGAVMSVPAHDERDLEFAKKFGLPIKKVVEPLGGRDAESEPPSIASGITEAFTEFGLLIESSEWSGKSSVDVIREMTEHAHKHGFGEAATTYRLRDWGVSRQRFWGSPIPIIYCDSCGIVPEKYENLPVELPDIAPFTGTGESPLAKVPEFYKTTCPKCGVPAKRETDTMDTFVDSSWYYFRYVDPKNSDLPFDPEIAAYWMPVDQYIGGDDHAVMHLIYTRFWTKVMRDLGLVNFNEPIKRLLTQGMVVGETFFDEESGKKVYHLPSTVSVTRDAKGKIITARSAAGNALKHAIERMSKSKGNGVDPDEMIEIYGADAARLFVLFAAPIENELVWHESGIEGAVRFLQRVWRIVWKWKGVLSEPFAVADGLTPSESDVSVQPPATSGGSDPARKLRQKTHQTIKKVTENFESLQFNTPVAALMELSNAISDFEFDPGQASEEDVFAVKEAILSLTLMLAPFAPHTSEEIYSQIIGNEDGMLANDARFPEYSAELVETDEIEIPVQVNGKLRSRLIVQQDISDEQLKEFAMSDKKVQEHIAGKRIVKVVIVPKRLMSIVVKG